MLALYPVEPIWLCKSRASFFIKSKFPSITIRTHSEAQGIQLASSNLKRSIFAGGERMLIKIRYQNNRFDMIKGDILTKFIQQGKIKEFYRYSEERWIKVESDPVRSQTAEFYSGREKRR
jgi:hypothetical protein